MIKQATLDLLDADLRSHVSRYKSYPYNDRYKLFSHFIKVDPDWSDKKYSQITGFNWSQPFRFADHPNFEQIINSNLIGIYVMYVRPANLLLDMPQHVMYVGISGEKGSARPLQDRLMDYFYIEKIKLRENIHQFLQLYYEHVYIRYSLFSGSYQDLEELEKVLHEYFFPRFGKRDFEPETKAAQSAWNTGQ